MSAAAKAALWLERTEDLLTWSDSAGSYGELRLDRIESVSFTEAGVTIVMFSGSEHFFAPPAEPARDIIEWWCVTNDAARIPTPLRAEA